FWVAGVLVMVLGVRSALAARGFAFNEFRVKEMVGGFIGGVCILEPVNQEVGREGTLVGNWLRHRAKAQEPAHRVVVDSNHGDILWCGQPMLSQGHQGPERSLITVREDCGGKASVG